MRRIAPALAGILTAVVFTIAVFTAQMPAAPQQASAAAPQTAWTQGVEVVRLTDTLAVNSSDVIRLDASWRRQTLLLD